jgi:hypothetical protein
MSIAIKTFAMPARTVNAVIGKRGSKYPLADLRAGTDDAIVLEGLDSKKDHSKLSSAVANFRKATGSKAKFSIRSFTVNEDGVEKTKVGLWKISEGTDTAAE